MKHLPIATLINFGTVIIGSAIGLFLQDVFSEDIKTIVFQAIGLGTLLIAIKMALNVPEGYMLVVIFSLILGGIVGEIISLDTIISGLSEDMKTWLSISDARFTEGLVTAFLLFCVGSMTIVGALEEGINGNKELILIKSTLDFFASIALASTYGIGVLFSAFLLLLFQGGISVMSIYIKGLFDDTILDIISSVGGLLILGIGIQMLGLGSLNLENLLPSIVFAVLLPRMYYLFRNQNSRLESSE